MTASPEAAAIGTPIDDWIEIGLDGRITIKVGKVELGTGVATALAQIAAEELDVPVERVDVESGHTGRTPDQGYTSGSHSIRDGGAALRHAAAAARSALLELAAARIGAEVTQLVVDGGVVRCGPAALSYTELMGGGRFHRTVTGSAPVKHPAQHTIVGSPVRRPDIARKVVAMGGFVSDVRLAGMRHARVVRPPNPGAHLLAVDASTLPGSVRLVRRGDFLAVAAEREEAAVDAAARLRVTWSTGPSRPSNDQLYAWMARQPTDDAVIADDGPPTPADATKQAHAEYRWPFQAHASIAPACAVADVRPDGATIFAAAQGVYPLRKGLAALLGLPIERVEVIHREGPGCYGHNGADDVAADAALISQQLAQPVRVQWSRTDEMVWARKGPAMLVRLTAGLNRSGDIRTWSSQVWTSTHGGRARTPERFIAGHQSRSADEPPDTHYIGGDRNAVVDYRVGSQRVEVHWLRRPAIPASSLRALGGTANTFANECFIDELAAACGEDPLVYRRRHLTDPRALAVLDAVAQRSRWGAPLPPGNGRGVAFARYENTGAYLAAVAEVSVATETGALTVEQFVIAHDCGLVINPDGLANQVEGNVIQSISRALKEEVRWDEDQILSRDWHSYPVLRLSQIPPVDVIIINRPEEPPVGAGEPATITTAPAIANAFAAATGARLREVPFTPQRVLAALSAVRQQG